MKRNLLLLLFIAVANAPASGQVFKKLMFTTGAGVVKVTPALHHVLKPALAFNSGFEIASRRNWYTQLTVDFNTLKYNQQVTDHSSQLLFRNANSNLVMIGLNGGKNFLFDTKWFLSAYGGGGFLNLGEPRIRVTENIAIQEVKRRSSKFLRGGFRVARNVPVKFLQTVYLDASWWGSPLQLQNYKLNGFAFFIGTRMSMTGNSNKN
jgi:hypothetical protein